MNRTASITPGFLLFAIFLVLKLTGVIAWAWIWVLAPLWIPIGVGITFLILAGLIKLVLLALARPSK